MARRRKSSEQPQATSASDGNDVPLADDSLGEELLREAQHGQAELVAGWKEFMEQLGICGKPIGARKLREKLLSDGIDPEKNEFSKGIIAMREE